jgi:Flp pilus assembly protein TadD
MLGRPEEALTDLKRSLAIDPNMPGTLHGLSATLRELGRPEEALAFLERELDLGANWPLHSILDRALLLERVGRTKAAAEAFDRARRSPETAALTSAIPPSVCSCAVPPVSQLAPPSVERDEAIVEPSIALMATTKSPSSATAAALSAFSGS